MAMIRPASDILDELETAAGAMLRIPSAFVPRDVLRALHADIIAAMARPVEGIRTIDDYAEFLCRALIKMTEPPVDGKWIGLAKKMLDQVKIDVRLAREEELRQLRDGR